MKEKRGWMNIRKTGLILLVLALFMIIIFIRSESSIATFITGSFDEIDSSVGIEDEDNFICEEFEENVLWSSGFYYGSNSLNYQTWTPKNTCNSMDREDCFLQGVIVNSRTIYQAAANPEIDRESYVQISVLDEFGCTNPDKGVYSTYLAYESIEGDEGIEEGWYCGFEKEGFGESDRSAEPVDLLSGCDLVKTGKLVSSQCYGIKTYASQAIIIDVFKIRYKLCWEKKIDQKEVEDG